MKTFQSPCSFYRMPLPACRLGALVLGVNETPSDDHGYPGTAPAISANGSTDGIVWAIENSSPAVLHAYDAADLTRELYNSNQSGVRDQFGAGNKFITPMIAQGRVYAGTPQGVAVFGLLH